MSFGRAMTSNESLKIVHAACPHDCPDACGVLIQVDERTGKAVSLRGDPRHPVTRGFLCAKVAQYLEIGRAHV